MGSVFIWTGYARNSALTGLTWRLQIDIGTVFYTEHRPAFPGLFSEGQGFSLLLAAAQLRGVTNKPHETMIAAARMVMNKTLTSTVTRA